MLEKFFDGSFLLGFAANDFSLNLAACSPAWYSVGSGLSFLLDTYKDPISNVQK